MTKIQNKVTGQWYGVCQIKKCHNEVYRMYAGKALCQKHFDFNFEKDNKRNMEILNNTFEI